MLFRSQPLHNATHAAGFAAQAAEDPAAESAFQRALLADMILGWESWDADRDSWRMHREKEWIPLIRLALVPPPFDVDAYISKVRCELVPWEDRGPEDG